MTNGDDTIAAIATATGVGGVGIVRVSGPEAIAIVAGLIGVAPAALDRRVRVAWARDVDGTSLDQVIAFAMRGPRSFTGEDVAEVQGHGGVVNLARLLAAVVARGARVAEPGEFTRRAVAHGVLDLARAEALLAVIHAGSERAWRQAQRNLAGELGARVAELEARALRVLAEVEGRIDFPDEDLGAADTAWLGDEIAGIAAACGALVDGFARGRAIEHGITVALVGPVNAGKSSLLNALVGRERALVSATPGTTRDYVEARVEWDGVAVTLVDTAGTRESEDLDVLERQGIALGTARAAEAEVVVVVSEDGRGEAPGVEATRLVRVRSKCDQAPALPSGEDADADAVIATSALQGTGLSELRARVLAVAGVAEREGAEQAFVTTARQHDVLVRGRDALRAALAVWRGHAVIGEVVALELRAAVRALAELRGVEVGERVLDEVFARFCIGK